MKRILNSRKEHQVLNTKLREQGIRSLLEEEAKPALDYGKYEVEQLAIDLVDYVNSNEDVVWYKDFFLKKGLTWEKVKRLAQRYDRLASAIRLAEETLESRYVRIPFHKRTAQKQCEFLLRKSIGGIWKDETLNVQVSDKSIFETIDAQPIIEVRESIVGQKNAIPIDFDRVGVPLETKGASPSREMGGVYDDDIAPPVEKFSKIREEDSNNYLIEKESVSAEKIFSQEPSELKKIVDNSELTSNKNNSAEDTSNSNNFLSDNISADENSNSKKELSHAIENITSGNIAIKEIFEKDNSENNFPDKKSTFEHSVSDGK